SRRRHTRSLRDWSSDVCSSDLIMSESPSDLGGYKEVIVRIAGDAAFSRLKFESGGHRVQRVPATESQGRIHTSACTVAVMPEARSEERRVGKECRMGGGASRVG